MGPFRSREPLQQMTGGTCWLKPASRQSGRASNGSFPFATACRAEKRSELKLRIVRFRQDPADIRGTQRQTARDGARNGRNLLRNLATHDFCGPSGGGRESSCYYARAQRRVRSVAKKRVNKYRLDEVKFL